ncbi:MAG: DpnD/PcfM family protein [Bacteroidaceae bacterium]|nr:DpnD/PcfM family protein [Bacteroidaceae bacterium]
MAVDAPSAHQAERAVTELYRACEIVLDDDDFQGVEFEALSG